jgi:hypothetical protein
VAELRRWDELETLPSPHCLAFAKTPPQALAKMVFGFALEWCVTLAIAGLALLHLRKRRSWVKTIGTVIEISGAGVDSGHAPLVEFRTHEGRKIVGMSANSSVPAAHVVGQQVAVWYDPKDPTTWSLMGSSRLLVSYFAAFVVAAAITAMFAARM